MDRHVTNVDQHERRTTMRLLVFLVMLGLPMAASAQVAGGPHDLRGTIPGLT